MAGAKTSTSLIFTTRRNSIPELRHSGVSRITLTQVLKLPLSRQLRKIGSLFSRISNAFLQRLVQLRIQRCEQFFA